MTSYNKIESQYNRFIRTLNPDELTPYEIKLINLISDNFDSVASVGTAAGKRALLLNELINENRDKLSKGLSKIEDKNKTSTTDVTRINSIEIENFRGFASKKSLTLTNPKF